MYKTNRQRTKNLILSCPETKVLFYLIRILIIMLIFITIFLVLVGNWSNFTQNNIKNRLFGNWNIAVNEISKNELAYFEYNAFINKYAIQYIQEKIFLDDKTKIVIGSTEEKFIDIGNIEILSGRMPIKNNEVAVEKEYLSTLGVNKIGDIISKDSSIKSLRGYSVCGILNDYSNRWKMVNWEMQYINCFIYEAKPNKIQVFLDTDNILENDIKTNFINYYNNVKPSSMNLNEIIIKIWGIVISLIAIIYLLLNYKLKRMLFRKGILHLLSLKILYIIITLFVILNSFFIIGFVNDIYFFKNYHTSFRVEKINNVILNKGYIQYDDGIYLITNTNDKNIMELKYMSNKYIDNSIELTIGMIYIFVANIILCCLLAVMLEKETQKHNNRIYLEKYFYNNRSYFSHIIIRLFCYYFFEFISIIVLLVIRYNMISDLIIKKGILLYCISILNIAFIIRFIFVKKYFYKIYNNII